LRSYDEETAKIRQNWNVARHCKNICWLVNRRNGL
jgi:hypothetical protein